MGFNLHHTAVEVIATQQETIQQLATGRINSSGSNNATQAQSISHLVAHKTVEVTTPGGIKVAWTSKGLATAGNAMLHGSAGYDQRGINDRYFGRTNAGGYTEPHGRDRSLHELHGDPKNRF